MKITGLLQKSAFRVFAVLVGLIGIRWSWILFFSASNRQTSVSPNTYYMMEISSRWRDDFWFDAAHDRHEIKVSFSDGRMIRWLTMDDRSGGWPLERGIQWADDHSSVTVTFRREGFDRGRVVIPLPTKAPGD